MLFFPGVQKVLMIDQQFTDLAWLLELRSITYVLWSTLCPKILDSNVLVVHNYLCCSF